ncbi:tyrosine-type recombinase/integrase [Vallitalea guaymasensis]|uniref:tyrosine-type recombinase/integrase n=1 Tax=Vallitalea guaymasensis TaxID=1185412 RepID=UPI000DE1EEB6|nr:tyrosine-type recombinase/integrase [Vallitalea guaymasensis]
MDFSNYIYPKTKQFILAFLTTLDNKSTRLDYLREINFYATYLKKDILEGSKSDAKDYIDYLKYNQKNKLDETTIYKKYSYLLRFMNYILKEYADQLPKSFANYFIYVDIKEPSKLISAEHIISNEDFNILMRHVHSKSIRDYVIYMLIYTSGLSISEVSKLKRNQLITNAQGASGFQFERKKEIFYVKIRPEVMILLQSYIIDNPAPTYIFNGKNDGHLSIRAIQFNLKKYCVAAGLKKNYTCNDLRHSGAVHAFMHGASKEALKKQFNIKESKYLDRYDNVVSELDKKWLCDYIEIIKM